MYYGFDIGGTKIEFAVYDASLTRCYNKRIGTPKENYQAILELLSDCVAGADAQFGTLGAVGIGFPGIINHRDQTIVSSNLPAIHGRHLGRDLAQRLNRPVAVDNDANCFLLSEVYQGAAAGARSALGVTIGTGIGGSIYLADQLIQGRNWLAGEIGHFPLPATMLIKYPTLPHPRCGCGRMLCFETYASGTGLERLYQHISGQRATGEAIVERVNANESHAIETIACWFDIMAAGIATAISVIDPDVVVLGGGLSVLPSLYEQLPARLPANLLPGVEVPAIKQAVFGSAGGVRGAALLNL